MTDRARVQYTICDDCGNSTLEHDKAVWTTDGASYCPTCRPMTADRRAALVKAVCDAMHEADPFYVSYDQASTAIDLIRAEVLEEAAKVAETTFGEGYHIAAAIRAMKAAP